MAVDPVVSALQGTDAGHRVLAFADIDGFIFKKGDQSDLNNWRLISLCPIFDLKGNRNCLQIGVRFPIYNRRGHDAVQRFGVHTTPLSDPGYQVVVRSVCVRCIFLT
ncbi:unnamed protein product [Macrosiphum euphorbiae]|uniref:Uncharacterized protein n=1 Tax=Macrosiphum euphorbiae TaxID=13131 RepID=A0AAV0WVA7_9HEMI|nr:unnamed protein product [Macrosiphum euphorbiae]